MSVLTTQAVQLATEYRRQGVVIVRNALTDHWLGVLRDAVDTELERGERYFAYRNMRLREGPFKEFCFSSGIGRIVAEIASSTKAILLFDQMFVKEPGSRTRTGWHSDQPYWPVEGPIMTVWIALDPVDDDNGALEFIVGSHDQGIMYRPFLTDQAGNFTKYLKEDDPRYVDLPDFEAERENHEIASWSLGPGDLLAFDGNIAHAAKGNRTASRRRRGYAVRFATDGATYLPEQGVADWLADPDLASGSPLESEFFPVVYRSGQAAA